MEKADSRGQFADIAPSVFITALPTLTAGHTGQCPVYLPDRGSNDLDCTWTVLVTRYTRNDHIG